MRRFSDEEKKILAKAIEEKSEKLSFSAKEIESLIFQLEAVSGFRRTIASVRLYLSRVKRGLESMGPKGVSAPNPVERIEKYLEATVKKIIKTLKKQLNSMLRQNKKEVKLLRQENTLFKNRIKELEDELRGLKKIQQAVEEFQKR